MTKATERVIKALKTGKKWHSKELFAIAETWDWRKAVSNAKKELKDYEWHTEQADKGMKYYWITPKCDAQMIFGGDNHSTDCNLRSKYE